ncbi:MAG TPA: molybdopterin-binding protein, partial [Planctomycetota bacterium]|nr:molybdopterin-binding protein [Planctomycetota bacterium]
MSSGSDQICPICKHPIASPMDAVGFPRSIELETCRVPEMSEAVTHYNCVFGLMKFNDLVLDIIDFYKQLHPQRDRIKVADRNVIYYIKDAHDLRVILLNSYVRCSMPPEKAPDFVADLQALYLGKPATRTGFCSPSPHQAADGGFVKRRNIFLHFSKDLTTLTPQGIRIERSLDFVDVRALEKLLPDFAAMAESSKAMTAFKRSATDPSPSQGTATAPSGGAGQARGPGMASGNTAGPGGPGGMQVPRVTRMIGRNIVSGASPLGQALQRIQQNMQATPNDPTAEPYSPNPQPPVQRGAGSAPGGSGMQGAVGPRQSGTRMAMPPIPAIPATGPVPPSIPHPGPNTRAGGNAAQGIPVSPMPVRQPNPIPHPTAPVQHLTPVPEIPMSGGPRGASPPPQPSHPTPPHSPVYARAFESHVGASPGAHAHDAPAAEEDIAAASIGVVTVSDRASAGQYEDLGGPAIAAFLDEALVSPFHTVRALIPDEREQLRNVLVRLCDKDQCCLILTTGGTGPAARDITPEVTEEICDK